MTKTTQSGFRATLENRQVELENRNRNRGALTIETSADDLDRIQGCQERDLAMGTLGRSSLDLREVRAALLRLDTGKFGICLDCEKEIHLKRLAAVPWVSFCFVCQEASDLEQAAWGEIAPPLVMAT